MKYLDISWKAELRSCPHCFSILNLTGQSIINKKCAITDLFHKINEHINCDCFAEHLKKKPSSIRIEKRSRNVQTLSLLTENEDDKIMI